MPRSAISRSPTMASLTGRDRMAMVHFGLIDPCGDRYAADVIGAFTVKATGPGAPRARSRAATCRNSSWAARSCSGRGARRLPADLGRRRGRGGGDPSGDRRSRGARLGGHGHLAGPRRTADTLRHARGDQSGPFVGADEGRRRSIEEIGLLMGGVHGDPNATDEMTEALHAHPA